MTLEAIRQELHRIITSWWTREIGSDTSVFLNPDRRRVKLQTLLTDLTLGVCRLLQRAEPHAVTTLKRLRALSYGSFPHHPSRLPSTPRAAYEIGFRMALQWIHSIIDTPEPDVSGVRAFAEGDLFEQEETR